MQQKKDQDALANERMRGVHDTLLAECLHGPAPKLFPLPHKLPQALLSPNC